MDISNVLRILVPLTAAAIVDEGLAIIGQCLESLAVEVGDSTTACSQVPPN